MTNTWGSPAPEQARTPWSTKRIVVSAVVAVVLVAGGTTAVVAATTGSPANATTGGGPGGGGFGGGGPGTGLGLANALHGDLVVANGNTYTTERLQTGAVTAVSTTAITVKSKDGYTQTYVVNSGSTVDRGADTISKVAKGNTVTLVARLSGRTATAATIEDTTVDTHARGGNPGPGGGFGNGNPPGN
ncbi:MAG TPA: hypothetical protein VGG05_25905 [Pseudonocardiaceae bacterium]|jgi:hypothetical protein